MVKVQCHFLCVKDLIGILLSHVFFLSFFSLSLSYLTKEIHSPTWSGHKQHRLNKWSLTLYDLVEQINSVEIN